MLRATNTKGHERNPQGFARADKYSDLLRRPRTASEGRQIKRRRGTQFSITAYYVFLGLPLLGVACLKRVLDRIPFFSGDVS